MARHPIRERLRGASLSPDRLFVVRMPDGDAAFTEYNQEVTGWTPELNELGLGAMYGMRPWPIFDACKERGWPVEEIEDRR